MNKKENRQNLINAGNSLDDCSSLVSTKVKTFTMSKENLLKPLPEITVKTLECQEGLFIRVNDLRMYLAACIENFDDDKCRAILMQLILKLSKL